MFAGMSDQAVQTTKHVVDGFSVGVLLAWITGFLGPLATLVTLLWLGMQIVMNWTKFKDAILGMKNKNRRKED
jgi:hypothetical protein